MNLIIIIISFYWGQQGLLHPTYIGPTTITIIALKHVHFNLTIINTQYIFKE
jgi:hypothetical protein